MADYTVASGDTFASLAKKFFGDDAAAKPLAKFNKVKDDSQPPAEGTTLSIPSRLYGEKSRETGDGKTTVTLSLFAKKASDVMIFFSPALKKYCVLEAAKDNAFSALSDEAKAAKDMVQKILDGWQGQDFTSMLTAMQDLSREVETFFEGLKSAPNNAIDELITVTKHPDWDESLARLFVRPKRIQGAGTWKDAADASVRGMLDSLRESNGDTGLASDALSALCPGAQDKGAWPWQWKFADAQAAASGAAQSFSSAVTARFVRFVAGCGLSDKLDELEKKVPLGDAGNLAFALDTGTLSGSWYLPGETGVNLFDLFGVAQSKQGTAPSCLLRLSIEAKGYACAEGNLSHFISLPGLSLGSGAPLVPQANIDAAGSAQAQAQGRLSGAISWSKGDKQEFADLATVDLIAPLGTGQQLSVAFSDNTLKCNVPVKNIKGLSGNGSLSFDVKSDEGMRLIEYIFACVVLKYCSGLTGSQDGFSSLISSQFKNVIDFIEKKTGEVTSTAQSFLSWFNNGSVVDGTANATWDVPDKQGFDLVAVVKAVPLLSRLVKPGAHCFVRMHIELSGYAFGSKSGGGSLPGGIPSVGAAGQGGLAAAVEWRASESGDFRKLGSVQSAGALSAMAGAAMAVPFAIEHKNGNLSGILSLAAVPGMGKNASGNVAFTASGAEADAFVNNLFSSLSTDLSSFLPAGAGAAAGLAKSIDPNAEKDAKSAAGKILGSL